MTLQLILMRHAKSSWDDPVAADFDRPLNGRGRRSAKALGHWLRQRGWLPDRVLCSSARRTRETLDGLRLEAGAEYLDALYHAGEEEMLACLRRAGGTRVLMIGHNPGIAGFAAQIVSAPPSHPRFADYPTGATLVAGFSAENWAQANWHEANTLDFVVPRDLPGM